MESKQITSLIRAGFLVIALCSYTGCSGSGPEELFETAQFEERQNNTEHAKQLYQQILDTYPSSDYAKKAQERLAGLAQTQH